MYIFGEQASWRVGRGNYVYQGGTLQFFNQPEGYVTPKSGGGYDYVYQYKDHLGNVRLSYLDNSGTTEIVEESNYYPFGLKHKGYNTAISANGNSVAQKWKFGGKELDESLGLETYDFGARNYDPALGRWMNIDPLAEKMRRHSPYNYAFNNPMFFIDPDGMEAMAPDDIKIYGKNENGERQLIVNLKTDKVHLEIDTDVTVPTLMDPITNQDTEQPILGEHKIDPLLPNIKDLPKNSNVVLSVGLEITVVEGKNRSLDVALFRNESGVVDAASTFDTKGETKGLFGGGGIQAGIVASKTGAPLTIQDFEGQSTTYNLGLMHAGGSFIDSESYSGFLIDVPNAGGSSGFSVSNNFSENIANVGNFKNYSKTGTTIKNQ
ncbi:RHS repeat domain-containing protein [Flagellimonas allohymeniacidonis]|uniref:RHS repeat-associated core domain-containing protein n=1 Tax=Flagellimonas allohymeniacidonis TaxID=2517819 RepID=A0A4V2HSN9_9FLAO|nr:RHS repeat-associated core domain-containing protein [Allomuricauda hymeniacidonis]TAI48490.1 RHS repeat-associated core domain-containing protein [Allomuricauda hymeniacidonis]